MQISTGADCASYRGADELPLSNHDELGEVPEIGFGVGVVDAGPIESFEREVGLLAGSRVSLLGGEVGDLDQRGPIHHFVLSGRFAEVVGLGGRIQDVITDLEGDADPLGVLAEGLDCCCVGSTGERAEFGRRTEQRTRLRRASVMYSSSVVGRSTSSVASPSPSSTMDSATIRIARSLSKKRPKASPSRPSLAMIAGP